MQEVISYIKSNQENYINELKEFLSIPSISTLPENKGDIKKCAEFVAEKLKLAGMSRVKVYKTEGHPLVYGEDITTFSRSTRLNSGRAIPSNLK